MDPSSTDRTPPGGPCPQMSNSPSPDVTPAVVATLEVKIQTLKAENSALMTILADLASYRADDGRPESAGEALGVVLAEYQDFQVQVRVAMQLILDESMLDESILDVSMQKHRICSADGNSADFDSNDIAMRLNRISVIARKLLNGL